VPRAAQKCAGVGDGIRRACKPAGDTQERRNVRTGQRISAWAAWCFISRWRPRQAQFPIRSTRHCPALHAHRPFESNSIAAGPQYRLSDPSVLCRPSRQAATGCSAMAPLITPHALYNPAEAPPQPPCCRQLNRSLRHAIDVILAYEIFHIYTENYIPSKSCILEGTSQRKQTGSRSRRQLPHSMKRGHRSSKHGQCRGVSSHLT
jgi:hypothetical protein